MFQSPRRIAWVVALTALAAFQAWLLAFQVSWFHGMKGFFWRLRVKELPDAWILPVLVVAALLIVLFGRKLRLPKPIAAVLLVLLGTGVQLGYAFMEGRGYDAIRARMERSGHTPFAKKATEETSFRRVAGRYEAMLESGELSRNPYVVKPPGTLATYMVSARAADRFAERWPELDPFGRLVRFAGYFWPFLTYWVVILTFLLGRRVVGPNAALGAAALFALAPNVTLMHLHLDQTTYPLLGVLVLWLFTAAHARSSPLLFALTGAAFYFGLFVSFGLAALAVFIAVYSVLCPAGGTETGRERALAVLRNACFFLLGFGLLDLAFRFVSDYDFVVRYKSAVEAHHRWKRIEWTPETVRRFALIDFIDYTIWIGAPLMALFLGGAVRSAVRLVRRLGSGLGRVLDESHLRRADAFNLALLATFCMLLFAGKTAAETGRLWLFLVPFLAISAAREIRLIGRGGRRGLWALVVVLQLSLIFVVKRYQDFF